MKKIQLILFFLIMFLVPNVFALEVDVTNNVTSPETSGTGKYRGTEILNTGTQATYNVKTRYQGRLSRIIYNLPLPSELGDCYTTNATYTVTMYMETNDWNNKFGTVKVRPYSSSSTNWSNGNVTYVSYKKIYFTFKIPSSDTTCYDFVWVDLPSTNISNTGITQISNWNLKKITLTDPTISSGGSSGGSGTTPSPTPDNTQQIIDSQNENAQNIIDSQNENAQNIIENNNENTEKIVGTIENKCTNLLNHKITSALSGVSQSNLSFSDNSITFKGNTNGTASNYVAYYLDVNQFTSYHFSVSSNPNLIYIFSPSYETIAVLQNGTTSTSFNTNFNDRVYILFYANGQNNTTYSDIMFSLENKPYCAFGTSTNRLDETTNAINQVNDSINNDNIDNGLGGGFFSDFNDNDFGLSSIITIPLNTIQSLTSTSCQPLSIPIPFTSSSIPLPCMSAVYEEHVPTVYSLWKVVSFGLIAYFIAIDIFKMVKGFKDPESDKVEVLDL